jgi:hypothetical protein
MLGNHMNWGEICHSFLKLEEPPCPCFSVFQLNQEDHGWHDNPTCKVPTNAEGEAGASLEETMFFFNGKWSLMIDNALRNPNVTSAQSLGLPWPHAKITGNDESNVLSKVKYEYKLEKWEIEEY